MGVRRYQDSDGSYTAAGMARYGYDGSRGGGGGISGSGSNSNYNKISRSGKFKLSDKQKKALKIGAAVAGTALVAAGAVYVSRKANKVLVKSMSRRLMKSGEDMIRSSMNTRIDAGKLMDYADKSKLRGHVDLMKSQKSRAEQMYRNADQMMEKGFALKNKGHLRNFTRKELRGEAKNLRKDIKKDYNTYLKYYRQANNMYNDEGMPNYIKKTMRKTEALSRKAARRDTKNRYRYLLGI